MIEREQVNKQPKKNTYARPLDTILQQKADEIGSTYTEILKPKQDKYKSTLLSIPGNLNRILDRYIGELKAQDCTIWDPINQINRKVSRSSWIVQLIEQELRKQGKIE
ncbi:hypothetical protein ABEY96_28180 [Priestia aryabhattai]|uniref:hypothetical protein n=1 Tax=Priestia aryabhattai TaxID=412384 RepID=UPI003D27E593